MNDAYYLGSVLGLGLSLAFAADRLLEYLLKCWRIDRIRARRSCRVGHTWGRCYGPVDDGFINKSYYWAWRCLRCGRVKTCEMTRAQFEATRHNDY